MSASASLRRSRCAAGSCLEMGSRADCRRPSSQCESLRSCTHRRRCLLSSRRRRERLVAGAASSPKRAARFRDTDVRAKTTPTTTGCAWPGRCALLWRCHSVPPCSMCTRLLCTNQRSALAETDGEIRITDARPNAVGSSASNISRSVREKWPHFLFGLRFVPFFLLGCRQSGDPPLLISLSSSVDSKSKTARHKWEQYPCVYSYHRGVVGRCSYLQDPIGIFPTSHSHAHTHARASTLVGWYFHHRCSQYWYCRWCGCGLSLLFTN